MIRTACLVALGLAFTGCAATSGSSYAPETPTSRYSLQVEPGLDRIALAVHEHGGLSSNQHYALNDLAARYLGAGAGWMVVQGPAGGDPDASRQAYAVRDVLVQSGVPQDRIRVVGYDAPDPRAPVLAGFETLRAAIPDCAAVPRTMGVRYDNASSQNFGCAITANMAAQIADPRDILGAKPMTPGDSGRAAVVFGKYRAGEISSTPQEPLVDGQISRAVE